jgi:hypothetical protein
MIAWRTQIGAVRVQAPLPPIIPSGKEIPQSFHALHKQLGDLWVAGLHVKVIQTEERPHKPVHDSGSGKARNFSVHNVSFCFDPYSIVFAIKLKDSHRTF